MSMSPYLSNKAEHLRAEYGGIWGEHPDLPASDWMYEVSNGDTRLGYWEWCAASLPEQFTLFFRSRDTGCTGSVHVEANEIAEAHEAFENEYPNVELIGAFAGHVMPLWWEQP